jgi:hypothetical protein
LHRLPILHPRRLRCCQFDKELPIGKIAVHTATQALPRLQTRKQRGIAGLATPKGRGGENPG